MNPEALRTEYELAYEAALESDAQVRALLALPDEAKGEKATMTSIDVARIITATLALNERLHERAERQRRALATAKLDAGRGA